MRSNSTAILISTQSITGPDNFSKLWGQKFNEKLKLYSSVTVNIISRISLTIQIIGKSRNIKLNIAKVKQSFGKSYLDVNVYETKDKLVSLDEHHSGLLALVYKNDYKFYEPVQNTEISTIAINGVFQTVHRKPIGSNRCYAIQLDRILFPRKFQAVKFQKSSI